MTLQEYLYEDYIKTNILPNIYINEDDNKESIKDKILNFIKNLSEDNPIIKGVQSYLNKNKYYKELFNNSGEDIILTWCNNKFKNDNSQDHKRDFYDAIVDTASRKDCFEEILKLIKDQNSGVKTSFYETTNKLSLSLDNIKKYYLNEPYNIPGKFWDIILLKMSGAQPVIGKGEFVLKIISDFPQEKNKKSNNETQEENNGLSDITINGRGYEIKYVAEKECVIGNDRYGNTEFIYHYFVDKCDKGMDISFSSGQKNNFFADVIYKKLINTKIEDYIDWLKTNINKFGRKQNVTYKRQPDDLFKQYAEYVCNKNITKEKFVAACSVLYMLLYSCCEGFDNICFIEPGNVFHDIELKGKHFNDIIKEKLPIFKIRCGGTNYKLNMGCYSPGKIYYFNN